MDDDKLVNNFSHWQEGYYQGRRDGIEGGIYFGILLGITLLGIPLYLLLRIFPPCL